VIIQTKRLAKLYGEFTAVGGIDLEIRSGEIYGFLGPNGAGKTSTIMMLLGMSRPTSGEILLFGEPHGPDRIDLRRRIGVVPEKHPRGMWTWMTAADYLAFFADMFSVKNARQRARKLLEMVGLAENEHKRIATFSRGMLQKLSFVRSLLHAPDILLLDEPISGLDPLGIKQIRDLVLAENREGRTIFMSSHLLSEVEKVCHRIAIISRGALVAEDTVDGLLSRIVEEREIYVEVDRVPDGLEGRLAALTFLRSCTVSGTTLVMKVPKEGDYRKAIAEFCLHEGLMTLRMQESKPSLEDAFITLTKENVGLIARGRR
jgi:ABC-type multidrug transport system ATPase subunit